MGGMGGGAGFSFSFGGGAPPQQQQHHHHNQRHPPDVLQVPVSLGEVLRGLEKTVEFDVKDACRTCSGRGAVNPGDVDVCGACGGQGRVFHRVGPMAVQAVCGDCAGRGRAIRPGRTCEACAGNAVGTYRESVNLTLPAGIPHGFEVCLEARGNLRDGRGAGADLRRNDLVVRVDYALPTSQAFRDLRVDDRGSVHLTIDVGLVELLCGFERTLDLYGGKETPVKSAGYVDPADKLTLPGLGLPRHGKPDRGDVVVSLAVAFPTAPSDDARRLREAREDVARILKHKLT